jgi:hypothetical protein
MGGEQGEGGIFQIQLKSTNLSKFETVDIKGSFR